MTQKHRSSFMAALLSSVVLVAASCSSTGGGPDTRPDEPGAAAGDPNVDKLAHIIDRGTLVLSTDLAYPPQSFAVEDAERLAPTACSPSQLTASEVDGFDVRVGVLVAEALGVEACFVTPKWTEITGGNWADRWDVSWGSGAINADRMERLYMTQPYYGDDQVFFVHEDSPIANPRELSGKEVGACAACTHELYLEGTLEVPGVEIKFFLDEPRITLFDVERPGLEAVAEGEIDAFICAAPVGFEAIGDGLPLKGLEPAPFELYSTGFLDKSSSLDQRDFFDRVNAIILGLHADGTLREHSLEYFGSDLTTRAAAFDLASIGQSVR